MFKISPYMTKIDPKMLKIRQIDNKYQKSAYFAAKILLTTQRAGVALRILPLVQKPSGHQHLMPRCSNNLQLCLKLQVFFEAEVESEFILLFLNKSLWKNIFYEINTIDSSSKLIKCKISAWN